MIAYDSTGSTATYTIEDDYFTDDEPIVYHAYTAIIQDYPHWDFDMQSFGPTDNWFSWWDWFRTGWFQQDPMKKWTVKKINKHFRAFWLRCLPHKSGWVGKAMARRKGA